MMNKTDILNRIKQLGIVAILRAPEGEKIPAAVDAVHAGGVDVIEIPFSAPGTHRVIEKVADRLGDQILLGAGTVLDPETARIAILSGAEFLVTPTLNPRVIEVCVRYGKPCASGAMTPTEILTAWESGAELVKVFPCDVLGPKHIKAVRGPLPQIPLVPTGGVNLDTAADFLRAGATALGVGGSIAPVNLILEGDTAEIEKRSREFLEVVEKARA